MRNLIICCDGTWNSRKPDPKLGGRPTNVVRLHAALADQNEHAVAQLAYYHSGVGTEGNVIRRAWGGLTGAGLDRNIMSAYRWLGATYQPDDRIFLIGFSRGAYTVRSLGGMLSQCGLLNLEGLQNREAWRRVERAYHEGYRGGRNWTQWSSGWKYHGPTAGKNPIPIHFLGVWDTVGALGIPAELGILGLLQSAGHRQFHDTTLGGLVLHARHAVAIDEMRSTFVPTLWTALDPDRDVKQRWFPGVHADVGGGYADHGLADVALEWMMQEAHACGLGILDAARDRLNPDPMAQINDSYTGVFRALKSRPRAIPLLTDAAKMHSSAIQRHRNLSSADSAYRQTHNLSVGEQITLTVYADRQWNEMGVYLEAGARYRFEAAGEWLDKRIRCGPAGTRDGRFHLSEVLHWIGSAMGFGERIFRRAADNREVDFWLSRRIESEPWFSLVGVLANGTGPITHGKRLDHVVIGIGEQQEYPADPGERVSRSGYLWCFANDCWNYYKNNRGSVELTVTRLA